VFVFTYLNPPAEQKVLFLKFGLWFFVEGRFARMVRALMGVKRKNGRFETLIIIQVVIIIFRDFIS
jgi:hypothetical protein